METPPCLYYDLKWGNPNGHLINDRSFSTNTNPSSKDKQRIRREAEVTKAKLEDPEYVFRLYCSLAYPIPGLVLDGLPIDYRERFEALNGHVEESLPQSPNGKVHAVLPPLEASRS